MWIFKKSVLCPWSLVRCKPSGVTSAPFSLRCPGHDGRRTKDKGRRTPLSHCTLLLAALCLLPSVFSLHAASGLYQITEIKPHVFVWVPDDVLYQVGDPHFSRAGTAGFIITSEGVVVVNTTNTPFAARDFLYEIRQRTALPVKYVINTDPRGDHMLGNEVFVDQQATIISTSVALVKMREYQADLKQRMKEDPRLEARMRGIHPTLPTQTFENEMTLRLGDQEIKLLDLGKGASAGDAAVYLPATKVIFLGDLYAHGAIPHQGLTDIRAWIEILRRVESMNVELYVPGEGSPGDKTDFLEFRKFLEWAADELKPALLPENPPATIKHPRMASVQ
jgi:glyoxylase-like metal-dependent hydrolase (beta-lactamase superfamily II)